LERTFEEKEEGLGVGGARASPHLGSPLVTCDQGNHSNQLPSLAAQLSYGLPPAVKQLARGTMEIFSFSGPFFGISSLKFQGGSDYFEFPLLHFDLLLLRKPLTIPISSDRLTSDIIAHPDLGDKLIWWGIALLG
jgi:hypothetical protein